MHPQDQLRDACCHLTNMIEDIDKLRAVPSAATYIETIQVSGS